MRLSRYLIVFLCALWAFAPAACADGEADGALADALRTEFPRHAALVLDERGPLTFERDSVEGEFIPRARGQDELRSARRHAFDSAERSLGRRERLDAVLPRRGDGAIRLSLPDGLEVFVREEGTYGEGEAAESAVVYRREGGISYWTTTAAGFEEWLLLSATYADAFEVIAAWTIEGASVRQDGDAIELVRDGRARLRVTAPQAFASSGSEVSPRLRVRGDDAIELLLDRRDALGQAVLIDPSWTPTEAMVIPRSRAIAAQLKTGEVLITGGTDDKLVTQVLAEIYDPASNTWMQAGKLGMGLSGHTMTLLPSGMVLVAGGLVETAAPAYITKSTQLFNPADKKWLWGEPLITARGGHSATLLKSGMVLVTGGGTVDGSLLNTSEIFDPSTNKWKPAAPMVKARVSHKATLLLSGRVLITGGQESSKEDVSTDSAEIYDPVSDKWTEVAPMSKRSAVHAMLLLPESGKVLAVGKNDGDSEELISVSDAELYDPEGNVWTPTGLLTKGTGGPTLTLLVESGKVLHTGYCKSCDGTYAEIYDPKADVWTPTKLLSELRQFRTATLLPNGKVLVAGGGPHPEELVPYAEVYDPGARLGVACDDANDCESGFCADGVCCDTSCQGACDACSIEAGALKDGACSPIHGAGPSCDDGDPCTADDVCQAGVCAGTPRPCEPSDGCHEAGACEPKTGACPSVRKPDGALCPGGFCVGGVCRVGTDSLTPDVPGGACGCGVAGSGSGAVSSVALVLLLALRRRRVRDPR